MARAINSTELTRLRTGNQFSELYLTFHPATPVFKCRIDDTFSSYDKITSFWYDTVTLGSYLDALDDMVVWIGTSEGARDKGTARIREQGTGAVLQIA
jgi:hypothetical protein